MANKRNRIFIGTGIIFGLLGLAVPAFLVFAIYQNGLTFSEIDWDQIGHVTFDEFFQSLDIGRRSVIDSDRTCAEYFSLKDGMRVRLDCT